MIGLAIWVIICFCQHRIINGKFLRFQRCSIKLSEPNLKTMMLIIIILNQEFFTYIAKFDILNLAKEAFNIHSRFLQAFLNVIVVPKVIKIISELFWIRD